MRRPKARKQRGAAMVESAIVLPVLAGLLLGIIFVGRLYLEAPAARAQARRCAQLHAWSGCQQIPPGCEDVILPAQNAQSPASDPYAQSGSGADSAIPLRSLPLVGEAVDSLFGEMTQADVQFEEHWPGSEQRLERFATYGVLCGQKPAQPRDVAKRILCHLAPFCGDE